MLKNYVLVALQHLLKQKLYTLINVAGLAVGLACFIVIGLFVRNEIGYDRQFADAERIYRVERDFLATDVSKAAYLATIAAPAAAALEEDFPEIEQSARLAVGGSIGGSTVETADGSLYLDEGAGTADNELFEIFAFVWLRGDPRTALERPYTVVLTRSAADKYFGGTDVLGQTLTVDDVALEVTGVIEDLGEQTHLHFSLLVSIKTTEAVFGEARLQNWNINAFYTYLRLRPGASAQRIRDESGAFFERRFQQGSSAWTRLTVTALTDIHLHSRKENEMRAPGSAAAVATFSVIAAFILLIACMNFMNLATARSVQRAKEIGVRKAIGAGRRQIVAQFLAESVLLALVALLLAATLVEVALPLFNAFMGVSLELDYLGNPLVVLGLLGLTLLTGLAAGGYPAFYLAAFEPGRVLKGDATRSGGAAAFRQVLVVLQFAIAIALTIATAVVYEQMRFVRNLDLGFDKDRVVVVQGSLRSGLGPQWDALKREWLAIPGVAAVTASNIPPGMQNTNAIAFAAEGSASAGSGIQYLWVDYGFFEAYRVAVAAGRTFDERFGTDRWVAGANGHPGSYVVSELASRRLGWTPDEALGKSLELVGSRGTRGPIVGVVEDVYYESVRDALEPIVYMVAPEGLGFPTLQYASLRITGRDLAATLERIDSTWQQLVPDQPIVRRFLDDDFAALYRAEERQGQMFTFFAALAIGVACLGLFGLASFTTERRTKEIGIRKAIGGGVLDIVLLLSGSFGRLVLAANVIAWPIAYLAMQQWLAGFAYRIDMRVWSYAGSAALTFAVAWLTVAAVAARAASGKPVNALRCE
jgi:putative ABC transport system permease protein